jgi:NhaA family Na+:H+ antiporter
MTKSKLLSPFQQFVKLESLGGTLLLISSLIALVWANTAFSQTYFDIWKYEFGLSFGNWSLSKPLILWSNDGLMAIFFFLIGLEIKREVMIGELNSIKKSQPTHFCCYRRNFCAARSLPST